MSLREEIRSVSVDLNTEELLRYLILERFPGKAVVSASLMASSIVVLKMVSDIDPKTPIVFCHPKPVFPESADYRDRIVEMLKLENYSITHGRETDRKASDIDHCERMWVSYQNMEGRHFQLLYLNDSLESCECWISAVYHVARPSSVHQRVDAEGKLVRVDPLLRWSKDDVRAFMKENKLPYHKRAIRKDGKKDNEYTDSFPSYAY